MRRLSFFLAWLTLVAVAVPAWAAADDLSAFVGRNIASVDLTIFGRPAPDEVRSLVVLQRDTPLSLEAVRNSVRSLIVVGRFESVEVLASDGPNGVAVVFRLVPRRPIDDLKVTGDTGLPADDLEALVKQQYGGMLAAVRPEVVKKTVESLLSDEGYLGAVATVAVVDGVTPDRGRLAIEVFAGPRATVRHVEVRGSSPFDEAAVLQQTGIAIGAPYRRRGIITGLVKLRDSMRESQYYDAQAVIDGDTISADGQSVDLLLTVDAGLRVIGPLFTGDPRPSGKVDELVPMKFEHSADDDLLDDATTRIETLLRREGYQDAQAPHTKVKTADGVAVTFDIHRGPLYRISQLSVTGAESLPEETVNRLLGVSRGDPLSREHIDTGVLQLMLEYRKRGYFEVKATPAYVPGPADAAGALVAVGITIVEGPQAHVADVIFQPESPKVPVPDLVAVMRSKTGGPFVAAAAILDQGALENVYQNRGYQRAHVTITPTVSEDRRAITLTVKVTEGTQWMVQDVRVIGNHRVESRAILEVMTLKPGQPLGAAATLQSRQNVVDMSGFRSVSITDEPSITDETRRHVIVTVDEAPATALIWGVGILVDRRLSNGQQQLDIGPRGSFEITRQNLGGRNRSIDFFTRLGLRSNPNCTIPPGQEVCDQQPGFGFFNYRTSTTYREYRAFFSRTDLVLVATAERDVQSHFNYTRQSLQASLVRRFTTPLTVTAGYALRFTDVFDDSIPPDERLLIDKLFPQVRLSTLATGVLWDRRDDPITPGRGTLTSANVEAAPRAIGSEVGFVKALVQGSTYRALDRSKRFVAAARAQLGVAHGFQLQTLNDSSGNPVLDPDTGKPVLVAALPASERFYAGGGTSVRGFNQDVLGVPSLITDQGLSQGGNGLLVLNVELRTQVFKLFSRDFGVVTFADSGNVFPNASDIRLSQLRGTLGFGFRYNSPVGPIRLDYGFKLSRLPFGASGHLEPGWTWHLSVGEAF
jgi:outer membrane protein assembly complex protein YaeT